MVRQRWASMVKELLTTIRISNLLILSLLYFSFEIFIQEKIIHSPFNFGSLNNYIIVLVTAAGGYVVNDLFDQKGDLLNNKRKFNWLSFNQLAFLYGLLTLCSISLAFLLSNIAMQQITCIAIALLFLYSWKLQHWPVIGNLIVAALAAVAPLITLISHPEIAFIAKDPNTPLEELIDCIFILIYALFAFLTTLTRELVKDMEDIEGDRAIGSKTLAVSAGIRFTKSITLFLFGLIALFVFILWTDREEMHFSSLTSFAVFLLLFAPICIASFKLYKANTTAQFHTVSNIVKFVFAGSIVVVILHSYT